MIIVSSSHTCYSFFRNLTAKFLNCSAVEILRKLDLILVQSFGAYKLMQVNSHNGYNWNKRRFILYVKFQLILGFIDHIIAADVSWFFSSGQLL